MHEVHEILFLQLPTAAGFAFPKHTRTYTHTYIVCLLNLFSIVSKGLVIKTVPYSGKFSYGANFRIFRMKPRDTKIKTAKILTVEILMSNFERAIEHVEAASKRWRFITVFLAFERPSRFQWTRLHPLACYNNETQRGK